jgi:2-oxoglutarate ferredoxin oxidoreductase subunit alpha
MALAEPTTAPDTSATRVNDFSITVGTKNGSGSQTSNLTIMRAIFKMGVPVSGKNVFPSNIQGLPTWYTIRASKDGFLARREAQEIVIAMNPDSFEQDLKSVEEGGLFIYADHIRAGITRHDILTFEFPAKELVKQADTPSNLRDYVVNMAYVGVLAQLIGIEMEAIEAALLFHFDNRRKPVDVNLNVIKLAAQWAADNLPAQDRFRIEPMDETKDFIMADGNTAAALGSIYGGVQLVAWYPITPASSLAEAIDEYLPKLRKEEGTGKQTYAVVQAEDELAAIGMAVGGGWAGLRAMTSTSGPGISLMTEFAGLAYYTETPLVVWDVQRMGPSTGLPTRTSQGDVSQVYFLGHGDTQNLILFPGSVNECFEFGWRAFDIAEQAQTPVYVLSDLDLGMNTWMTEPFKYPDVDMQRGKVLWEEDIRERAERYGRYLDVDGDGITWRTIPGNRQPGSAWFARGTGHDEYARYTEKADDWDRNMERLAKKFKTARQFMPAPVIPAHDPSVKVGIISYGSTDPAILEGLHRLGKAGVQVNYMRLRSVPFTPEVGEFIAAHDRLYIIEMNHTGQMHQILTLEFPRQAGKFISIPHNNGLPLTARWVASQITEKENK